MTKVSEWKHSTFKLGVWIDNTQTDNEIWKGVVDIILDRPGDEGVVAELASHLKCYYGEVYRAAVVQNIVREDEIDEVEWDLIAYDLITSRLEAYQYALDNKVAESATEG